MRLGGTFYIKGGNSYFAPEAGLEILWFEYEDPIINSRDQPLCLGLGSALKYGYDFHLSGKFFLGGQLFISYAYAWETESPERMETPVANSFLYGAALSLKLGK